MVTEEERNRLADCLYAPAGEDRETGTCGEFFRETDPKGYGRFLLQMAAEYYAGCETGYAEAAGFFAEAAHSLVLSRQERQFAGDMEVLARASAPEPEELDSWERLIEAVPGLLTETNIYGEKKPRLALAVLRGVSVRILYGRETGALTGESAARAQEVVRKIEECLKQAETMQTMRDQVPENLLQTRSAVEEARDALSGEAYWR